ncbi:sensor histidine kinase [Streptomyces anthocyanicus]|uniref:sensor histidine kinase n=1 Tax=Streptomyces anthocyanicus TaxID=68174 RepID=UPI0038140781
MSDSALTARPATTGHRRRRPPVDANTLHLARRAVALPLMLLTALLDAAFALRSGSVVGPGWALAGLVCGLAAVVAVAARGARTVVCAVQSAVEESQAAALNAVTGAAAAVEKSVRWSADELCRGKRPPLPAPQTPQSPSANAGIENVLSALQPQAIASLIRVHDESQSVVLLEVLRRLAQREHSLVGRALEGLTELEKLTDDPELLEKIYTIDHLVTRMRRQVESTAVLGGQSLRSVRRPVSVTTVLRGAVSEVVQYPRVAVAAGSVGVELGLPGHVGPDLSHLLAELIENSCEYSDPATRVVVRAQRVPAGLAVEVEDRAIPMGPEVRERMNHLLAKPDEVDVSEQVRAGQVGLLVAAKIAQRHGLLVRLQENMTGGTAATVVVPTRLLVSVQPVGTQAAPQSVARPPAVSSSRQAPASPAGPSQALPTRAPAGSRDKPGDVPVLPKRRPQPGAFKPPAEREQPPATAATPGLAGAFLGASRAAGTGAPPTDPPGPHHS